MWRSTIHVMFDTASLAREDRRRENEEEDTYGVPSMTRKFAYSYDREDYTGAFGSPELACQAAIQNAEGVTTSPPTTIYVGALVEPDPQATDHADTIINNMSQRAHVDFGEPASRYLKNVTPQQVKELDQALEQTILGWLKSNKLMPTFVRVQGIREYAVSTSSAGRVPSSDSNEVKEIGLPDQSQDQNP